MTIMSNNDYLQSPSGIGTTFGFESARGRENNNNSEEMLLGSADSGTKLTNTQIFESAYIPTDRDGDADIDADQSLISSVTSSPRNSTAR